MMAGVESSGNRGTGHHDRYAPFHLRIPELLDGWPCPAGMGLFGISEIS